MRQRPNRSLVAAALGVALLAPGCGSDDGDRDFVWPIGGTDELQPISSSFGPRLQASRSSKYDFHRGVDIPAFIGTPIYAIGAGKVTRSGRDPTYTDLVVQIEHCEGSDGCVWSNYLHLSLPLVEIGDHVERGQQIAYSGFASDSGFPHLHFEIREGVSEQDHCVHPLRFLPIPTWLPPTLAFTSVDDATPSSVSVEVEVVLPAIAAGLQEVSVRTAKRGTGETIEERVFDVDAWNREYTEEGSSAIDSPDHKGIHIEPSPFNEESPFFAMRFRFRDLMGAAQRDDLAILARARDVSGNEIEIAAP